MKLHRHFILTSGRCGSNYLANTLNQSPEVVNYGEVLGFWTMPYKLHNWAFKSLRLSREQYLEYVWSNRPFLPQLNYIVRFLI